MGTSPRHIAILQTAFLGDTLLSIPLAKELKRRGYLLTLLCRVGLGEIFRATGLFSHVIEIEKGEASSYQNARHELNKIWKDADTRILLSPHESQRSKFFALKLRLSREATETIGFRDRSFALGLSRMAYTHLVDRPMNLPESLRQMALLTASCFEKHEVWSEKLATYDRSQGLSGGRDLSGSLLSVPDWASMRVEHLQDGATVESFGSASSPAKLIAILAPGSVWKTKQWTEEGFVEIGKKLSASGRHIVVTGSKDEAELCQRIAERIAERNGRGAVSYAGVLSLLETAQVMAKADVAVVNDSGSMHLAALVGTPTVAIFGPTVLDFGYRPWSEVANVVEPSEALSCRPCGLHGSQVCPIGTHICMKNTTATQVWQKIETLLVRET